MTLLRRIFMSSLLLLGITTVWAQVNVPGPTTSDDDECGASSSGGTSPPNCQSLSLGVSLGLARYQKPTALTALGQTSYELDGKLPDFSNLYGRYFSASPLQQRQVRLGISQPQLSAATFHPSCLFLKSEALFEKISKPAANGFPAFIHQIVTDDAFTLVDLLPAPESGWRLRVWKKDAIAPAVLTKTGGYYVTTGFEALSHALTDVTFKRPAGSTGDNTLHYLQLETTGISGTRTITNEVVQTLDGGGKPATVTTRIFAGAGTGGPLLSQENLSYSARGSKAWDYTITREVLTASVNESGSAGDLQTTAKSQENYDDFSTTTAGGELGMKRLISRTEAYDVAGQSPQTTTYTYINTPTNATTHGRLQSTLHPDGSWNYSEYSISPGNPVSVITEYSSWKDLGIAQRANARKTETTVTASDSTVIVTVAGQLISKTKTTLATGVSEIMTTAGQWDGSGWHTTTTGYFLDSAASPSTGRIKWVEDADGTATTYTYAILDGSLVVTDRKGVGSRSGITAGSEVKTTYSLGNQPIAQTTHDIVSALLTGIWTTDETYNGGFDPLPSHWMYGQGNQVMVPFPGM